MRDTFGTTFTEFEVAAARRRETIADDRWAGRHQVTTEVAEDGCGDEAAWPTRPTRQRTGLGAHTGATAGAR